MLDQGVAQSTELVFKDDDSVYKLAEKHERLLLIYEEIVYDVTEFSDRHPGGYDIIEHYSGQDITEEFHDPKIHKHTKSALNQLMQFRIGKIDDDEFQVLTQYLIDYQEFQLDRSKPLLNYIDKLTPEQFALMKKQDIVYYPFSENPKNFIQFEETPVKEQELWYKRNNLGDLELILGVIGLIIVLIQQREWLSLGLSIVSVFADWRKILKCITFSKRSSQFRFMQQLIPIKRYNKTEHSYVTRNQCLAEICLVLLYTLPYTNIYATIQLFIMGFKHKQLYDLPDSEFLKM